jgi:hypothetical protein
VKSFARALIGVALLGGCGAASEPPARAPAAAPPERTAAVAPPSEPAPVESAPAEARPPIAFGSAQPLNLTVVDEMLAALVGEGRGLSAADFLMKLGFDADDVAPLSGVTVNEARRIEDNLDPDPELESVILLDAVLPSRDPNSPGRQLYLVWAREGPPLAVLGRMRFAAESCGMAGSIDIAVRPVHSPAFADTVVTVDGSLDCEQNFRASHRSVVLTLARGKLEAVLDFEDESEIDRDSGKTLDPRLSVVLTGKPPQRAEVQDSAQRTKRRLLFDSKSFSYR